jgi:hypothetical protein
MKRSFAGFGLAGLVSALVSVAEAGLIGDFTLESAGTFTQSFPDAVSTEIIVDSLVISDPDGLGFADLDAAVLADLTTGGPFPFTGSLTLSGPGGELFGDISGEFFDVGVLFSSAAGTIVFTGGTGNYADLVGTAVFSAFQAIDGSSIQIKIGGVLTPGPGSLALLGIAGVTLAAHHRRRIK